MQLLLTQPLSFVPISRSHPLDDADKNVLKQTRQTSLERGSGITKVRRFKSWPYLKATSLFQTMPGMGNRKLKTCLERLGIRLSVPSRASFFNAKSFTAGMLCQKGLQSMQCRFRLSQVASGRPGILDSQNPFVPCVQYSWRIAASCLITRLSSQDCGRTFNRRLPFWSSEADNEIWCLRMNRVLMQKLCWRIFATLWGIFFTPLIKHLYNYGESFATNPTDGKLKLENTSPTFWRETQNFRQGALQVSR